MNTTPTIMVSSTFYDLHQVRTDLRAFIADSLGYIPLLSEYSSFPVDPDVDTVENCRRRVQENADIMVLVVGGRYGSIDPRADKSITNLEYLAARAKGIPTYVFIEKNVLGVLQVWKANPSGDFSAVVDTPRVFEFIESIRLASRAWTFEFEHAQDIIGTLRQQVGYLLQDGLRARQMLSGSGMPRFLETLRPKALRLALERPEAWQPRLFLQAWLDEVERRSDAIREYRAALRLGTAEYIPLPLAADWFQTRIHEIGNLVASMNALLNESLQEAMGTSNTEQIVWVSHMIGRVLERTIEWAQRIRCARFDVPFDAIAPDMALLSDDLIHQFEEFPKNGLRQVEEGLLQSGPVNLRFEFEIGINREIADRLLKSLDDTNEKLRKSSKNSNAKSPGSESKD